MSLEDSLAKVVLRHAELAARLTGENPGGKEYVSMSREFAELAPVVEAVQALADARQQGADLAAHDRQRDRRGDAPARPGGTRGCR